jgi:hypothetical protein
LHRAAREHPSGAPYAAKSSGSPPTLKALWRAYIFGLIGSCGELEMWVAYGSCSWTMKLSSELFFYSIF